MTRLRFFTLVLSLLCACSSAPPACGDACDASVEDASRPDAPLDAGTDAGCVDDDGCRPIAYCAAGACLPCDADGDGHASADAPLRCAAFPRDDCDDESATRYPTARPSCATAIAEDCNEPQIDLAGWELGIVPPAVALVLSSGASLARADVALERDGHAVLLGHADTGVFVDEIDFSPASVAGATALDAWAGTTLVPLSGAPFATIVRQGDEVSIGAVLATTGTSFDAVVMRPNGVGPASVASRATFAPADDGYPGLLPDAPPVLTVDPATGDILFGLPTNGIGAPASFFATSSTGGALEPISTVAFDADVLTSSSTRHAILAVQGSTSYFVWNGSVVESAGLDGLSAIDTAGVSPISGQGSVVTIDDEGRAFVVLPTSAGLSVQVIRCDTAPGGACTSEVQRTYPLVGRQVAASALGTGLAVIVSDADRDELVLWLLDPEPTTFALPLEPVTMTLPALEGGATNDLSLDVRFEQRASPDELAFEIAYSYLRASSDHAEVGLVRGCARP